MDWVVLELTSRGDQDDPDLVRGAISTSLKNAEVFLPAAVTQVGGDRVVHHLLDGYAFVRLDRAPADYFRLEGSKYVQSILVKPGVGHRHKRVSTVSDREILRMQDQIHQLMDQGIGIGDVVKVTSGPYRNMRATVVEEIPEMGTVQVYIRLRSKQSLVMLPRSFLVIAERAPFSSIANRLNNLRTWALGAQTVLCWDLDPSAIWGRFQTYRRVEFLRTKGEQLTTVVGFPWGYDTRLAGLQEKHRLLEQVSEWRDRALYLFNFVFAHHEHSVLNSNVFDLIQNKLVELQWLDDLLERIRQLWEDIDTLSREMAQEESSDMVQNVIVDGHNLAFRCLHAPGISNLTDSQGRPTGMILGFLRSLGSLKKRYPDASMWVTWDGSSQRRKHRFGEYKANRPPRTPIPEGQFDQFAFLREVLPLFGIRQAWNPVEEADDVIATLVRGSLNGQNNVIFSSDRDLIQLVTPTTTLLYPAVGSRNEIVYGPAAVSEIMGVPPEKMVHLRALYGDDSDNIPGVPRVPKKVLKALLQAHGSISGIFQSGLAGLSKGQYERLRAAEPQIRINVELMSLTDVGVTTTPPDVDPDNAGSRLRELGIDPDPLLSTFFGSGHQP